MSTLLDTNILVRLAQPHHPYAPVALRALRVLQVRNEALCIVQQNVVEYWAVTTRPIAANGLAFTTEQVAAKVDDLRHLFMMLPETPLQDTWERLVIDHRVSGRNVHDARLVAAMLVNGIETLLTFNVQDFLRYGEIRVLDAAAVV